MAVRLRGAAGEIPALADGVSNPRPCARRGDRARRAV